MPLSAAKRIALRDPLEHRVARDADRVELQVGDRRLDHREAHAELDEQLEVGGHGAREAPDLGAQAGGRDQLDRAPVVVRDAREAGLDAVDAELVEQPRDLELLLGVEHDADGLLAVAQRRVVEADVPAEAVRVVQRAGPDQVVAHGCTAYDAVGERRELLGAVGRDQEVVLDAQAAAALPVAAGLDREHHPLLDRAAAGLVRVRRLVRARADAVAIGCDGWPGKPAAAMPVADRGGRARRGSRPAGSGRSRGRTPRAARPRARGSRRAARPGRGASCGRTSSRRRRPRSRTASARRSCTGRSPVAVNVLMPAPDQTSEKPSASSTLLPRPARALAVDEPLPERGRLALLHPGPQLVAHVLHRRGADLVREPDALELLVGLDRARGREQRRRVDRVRPRVEPALRERRRLADHAVGGLRAERELEADAAVRRATPPRAASSVRASGGRGSVSS